MVDSLYDPTADLSDDDDSLISTTGKKKKKRKKREVAAKLDEVSRSRGEVGGGVGDAIKTLYMLSFFGRYITQMDPPSMIWRRAFQRRQVQ